MKVKGKLQIPSTNSRKIFESKLQTPTSKLQRNFKLQAPVFGFGAWGFSGAWRLDVGA
jgi:hypothetical protein